MPVKVEELNRLATVTAAELRRLLAEGEPLRHRRELIEGRPEVRDLCGLRRSE